jgi:hypothetical protein
VGAARCLQTVTLIYFLVVDVTVEILSSHPTWGGVAGLLLPAAPPPYATH